MNSILPVSLRRWLSRRRQQAYYLRLTLSGQKIYLGTVELDKVLIGQQCGCPLERWIPRTSEWERGSCPLSASPYVRFLQSIEREPELLGNDDFLASLAYFRMAQVAVAHTGSYFGATNLEGIRAQMRKFYGAYADRRDGVEFRANYDDYRHSRQDDPIQVAKIKRSSCYELRDGHHRASMLYVLGQRKIEAQITGSKFSYLQRQVLQGNPGQGGCVLKQPLSQLEVKDWPFLDDCDARFASMNQWLKQAENLVGNASLLHVGCGYGWYVRQFATLGYQASGSTRSENDWRIGRGALKLQANQIQLRSADDMLQSLASPVDVLVYSHDPQEGCLWKQTPARQREILGRLDSATSQVLLIECGCRVDCGEGTQLPPARVGELCDQAAADSSFGSFRPLTMPTGEEPHAVDQRQSGWLACIK